METAVVVAEERQIERETYVEEPRQSTLEMATIRDENKIEKKEVKQNEGGCCIIM